jgi:hypothetical protein
VSEITNQESTAAAAPAVEQSTHRIWPSAVVGFGLGLTTVWIFVLAYGAIKLVDQLMDTAFSF